MQVDGSFIKEISKLLKAPYILFALLFASGLILFLPDNVIKKMYMFDFRDKFGFIIGIIFVLSLVFLILLSVKYIYDKYSNKKFTENVTKYLIEMNNNDKIEIIKQMLAEDDHTLELPTNNGIVIELQQLSIITPAGTYHCVDLNNPIIPFFYNHLLLRIYQIMKSYEKSLIIMYKLFIMHRNYFCAFFLCEMLVFVYETTKKVNL